MKYCIVCDKDSEYAVVYAREYFYYCVPLELRTEFYRLLALCAINENFSLFENKFKQYKLDKNLDYYCFENFQEI